ncbi:hypothetical protein [Gilvibacter sp.]|uniref:hypothetical protein n=1 Tax=Gilvibacter sp. TaxID=2729997 RepID=UPI003B527D47
MKFTISLILFIVCHTILSAQDNFKITESLREIENESFKGLMINDSLLIPLLFEYKKHANNIGMKADQLFDDLYWIIIEPESNTPSEFKGLELGKVDIPKKMILLSRYCKLDRTILQATLFRELHHFFGVPYTDKGGGIMSRIKPEGYSYAWLDDPVIREIELSKFFNLLKN